MTNTKMYSGKITELKRKFLWLSKNEEQVTYKRKSVKWINMFKILKGRICEQKILYPGKLTLKYKDYCYQFAKTQKITFSRTLLEESYRERAPNSQND